MQQQSRMGEFQALIQAARYEEAIGLLHQLAEAGDPDALFTLGDGYWRGAGLEQDMPRGRELVRMASDAGQPIARRAYTNLLASGHAGTRDWAGALARLREEARDDSRRAHMLRIIEAMELTDSGDPRAIPEARRLSDSPDVVTVPGLFTRDECAFLIEIAEPSYVRATVRDERGHDFLDPIRTADGAPLHWMIEDPATHALNRRIAAASGTRYDQGEPLLILRYRPGQEYRSHLDALPGVGNNRVKTALVYLNDAFEGGETAFKHGGLAFRGGPGDALIFGNLGPDGRGDPRSEHAGRPVTQGTKYLASRWIRQERNTI